MARKTTTIYHTFSMFSLTAGVCALLSFFYPPAELVLGAAALMLAWLSRNGHAFSAPALAGFILGIINIIGSLVIYSQFMLFMDLARDPENSALIREMFSQSEEIVSGFLNSR